MNITIPIECAEGHQYLLKLSDCKNLPIDSGIEIVDIALVAVSNVDIINNAGTLSKISLILFNFLDENDVILYFYCAKEPIKLRTTRRNMSNQEYRSYLFSSMFKRTTASCNGKFIDKPVILRDESYGDHYIHIIAKSQHIQIMDKLYNAVCSLQK